MDLTLNVGYRVKLEIILKLNHLNDVDRFLFVLRGI